MTWGAYLLVAAAGACAQAPMQDTGPSVPSAPRTDASQPAAEAGTARDAGHAGSGAGAGGSGSAGTSGAPALDAAAPALPDASVRKDADADAGDAGSVPGAGLRDTRPIAAPPSYLGSVDNSAACSRRYPTIGVEPIGAPGERFPLFLYFVGTAFVQPDASASHDGQAARAVSAAMARRGFVALSVAYDNGALAWISDHEAQLACLFGDSPDSVRSVACALTQVDCERGIAVWGHSQGAFVGVMAPRFDPRVRAAWATGYGGDARSTLAKTRLRVVNGEADTNNGTPEVLNMITGLTAADCPTGQDRCLRADGSGWIIVRKSELADPGTSSADHCWFDKRACLDSAIRLEPTWTDPASTRAYALELNADWLARTARMP